MGSDYVEDALPADLIDSQNVEAVCKASSRLINWVDDPNVRAEISGALLCVVKFIGLAILVNVAAGGEVSIGRTGLRIAPPGERAGAF